METCFQRRSTLPFRPNGLNRAGVFAGDHSRVVPGLRRKALTYPPLRACRKTDFLDFCSHRRCRAGLKSALAHLWCRPLCGNRLWQQLSRWTQIADRGRPIINRFGCWGSTET